MGQVGPQQINMMFDLVIANKNEPARYNYN